MPNGWRRSRAFRFGATACKLGLVPKLIGVMIWPGAHPCPPGPLPGGGGSSRWINGKTSICSNPRAVTFTGKDGGELVFAAVEADLDVRYGSRDGAACAEFSW